ncbi:MAG: tRNA (adenine-N1)-methyltransferase [Streptosporangiaceae bacterium]
MNETRPASPRRGSFQSGDRVQLTDRKGRRHMITLEVGGSFHSHRGTFDHDDLIGAAEGSVVRTNTGAAYLALRPLLADYTLAMRRGATVVYPKDAAQIVAMADVFPGARVIEAGAGSGALTCWLLRAVGDDGVVASYERREDFARIARRNVERFFGGPPTSWRLTVGDVAELDRLDPAADPVDRVILDMLSPSGCLEAVAKALVPGGVVCCYVATTTQLARIVEGLRAHGAFDEPMAWESFVRSWHVEGLAVRPSHRMVGHTGFLVTARRLADGAEPLGRRRRPAKGAYGEGWETLASGQTSGEGNPNGFT